MNKALYGQVARRRALMKILFHTGGLQNEEVKIFFLMGGQRGKGAIKDPFPQGRAAGEGRYNTHFTKAQCQNSTFTKIYGIISLTNKNNPLILLFIFFKRRR